MGWKTLSACDEVEVVVMFCTIIFTKKIIVIWKGSLHLCNSFPASVAIFKTGMREKTEVFTKHYEWQMPPPHINQLSQVCIQAESIWRGTWRQNVHSPLMLNGLYLYCAFYTPMGAQSTLQFLKTNWTPHRTLHTMTPNVRIGTSCRTKGGL